ncbi:MAG TPA: protein kinase [Vicinamibacterales bacterium]|nr:protein kinase [Vicinamibacterales bacterium]
MTPEQWQEIERLYYASIDLAPSDRSRHLAEACADDEIRREVASLLAHRDRSLSVIERPALQVLAGIGARDHPPVLVGRRVGRYEVTSLIGAGGMGVVYRARDTRLERDVALKLLPGGLGDEAVHLDRLQQEARLLASLNHPGIAAIHDLVEVDGIRCLVLELIDGETLADRLKRKPMRLEEGLRVCREIAEALEAAHERGVVHRDLKPANVMITPAGSVKVLDFGIARMLGATVLEGQPAGGSCSTAVTVTGTPPYVSPEQAAGNPADKRADIWAFGCVLYELLTGRRTFDKASAADTLAAVSAEEPDWSALPWETPPEVADLLRRCLQKNPHWRLRDIGDARIALVEQGTRHADAGAAWRRPRRIRRLWGAALAGAALSASFLTWWLVRGESPAPELRLEVTTPPTADPVSLAISPDGRHLVYVATNEGRSQLWLRSLNSLAVRALTGTDHASCPFWSPDGTAIGFFADGMLKRAEIENGAVQEVTGALSCGGTWNRDGVILYSGPLFGPISRIPGSSGGSAPAAAREVTRAERPRQRTHRFPQFLPDQRHFLYYVGGHADARGVYVGDLGGAEPRRLLDADTAAVYASGHLLFVRQGALVAQAFDPVSLALAGDPFQIADQVAFDPARYAAAVSATDDGVVVYRAGSAAGTRQFVWVDRAGNEVGKVGEPDSSGSLDPSLSPDEQRVAFYRTLNAQPDIWLLDTKRGISTRFTIDGALRPIWSPTGSELVYAAGIPTNLFRRPVAGPAGQQVVLETSGPKAATDWSRDGRLMLYRSLDAQTGWDLWALSLDGTPNPIQIASTRFDERDGQFSPDAKWIAYQSNESGRFEVYVQPFPPTGDKRPVSGQGGAQVRWRADGRELFYVAFDNRLMSVPVRAAGAGAEIELGTPQPLFNSRIGGAVQGANRQQYMVSRDGRRFLMNAVVEQPTSPIVVLLNWRGRR